MKLWLGSAWSRDWEPHGLLVASDKEEASKKWKEQLDEQDIWYLGESVKEISEVDGYKVVFKKGKKITLEG